MTVLQIKRSTQRPPIDTLNMISSNRELKATRKGKNPTGEAPVVVGERRAYKTTEGSPDESVGLGQSVGLKRGRDRSTRVENLSPPSTRAEKGKGPVCITVSTDGLNEGRRLCDPLGE